MREVTAGKAKILVADDDAGLLTLLATQLRSRGFDVITARDGREALSLARSARPDAAVLDWMMPGVQGPEVCARIKDSLGEETPVVMLSARSGEEAIASAFACGVDDYVTKPFALEEVSAILARLFSESCREHV